MTDIIELPNDGDNYFRIGYQAARDNNFKKALKFLIKSFELTGSIEAMTEILSIYYHTREINMIIAFIENNNISSEWFLENPTLAEIYLYTLVSSDDYDRVLLSLYDFKEQIPSSYILDYKIQQAITNTQEKRKMKSQWLGWISDKDIPLMLNTLKNLNAQKQLAYLEISYPLSFREMFDFYQSILLDKEILNFVKTDILHHFNEQPQEFIFDFRWFDELNSISNNALIQLNDDPNYLHALNQIKTISAQKNPHLTEMILHALRIQTKILYPFTDVLFANPFDWYDTYLSFSGLEDNAKTTNLNQNQLRIIYKVIQEYALLLEETLTE